MTVQEQILRKFKYVSKAYYNKAMSYHVSEQAFRELYDDIETMHKYGVIDKDEVKALRDAAYGVRTKYRCV